MEPCWNGHGYCGRAKHFSGHWENSAGGWVLIAPVWDKPPATNQPTNQLPTSYQPAISCEKRGEIPGFSDRHLMIFQHNSSSAQASCMLRHAEARALWNGADLSIWWTESRLAGMAAWFSIQPNWYDIYIYITTILVMTWKNQLNNGIYMSIEPLIGSFRYVSFFLHLGWLPDFRGPSCAGKPE